MRFRRGRTRRPRRLRWIEGISQTVGSAGNYEVFPLLYGAGTANPPIVDVLSPAQIQDQLDGNGTLIRLVGDMSFSVDVNAVTGGVWFTGPIIVWVGIRELEVPPAGVPSSWDPSDAAVQDASWLYMKQILVHSPWAVTTTLGNVSTQVSYPSLYTTVEHVDIKARRRLRQDTAISMFAAVALPNQDFPSSGYPDGVAWKVNMTAQLRVLCKLN